MGAALLISYIIFGFGGFLGLHPDFGFFRKMNSIRTIHKWVGRALVVASWGICVQGLLKVAPANQLLQAAFVLPLLFFGFYALL